MNKEEKLKQLINLLEIDEAVKEAIQGLKFFIELSEEDIEETKKFLFDAIVANLTEFLNRYFSDVEIELLISFFSNKELQEALAIYDKVYSQVLYKIEFELDLFFRDRDLMKHTNKINKKDLN